MLSCISCESQKLNVSFKEKVLQKEFNFIRGDPEINHPAVVGCLFCPQRLYLGDVHSEYSAVRSMPKKTSFMSQNAEQMKSVVMESESIW